MLSTAFHEFVFFPNSSKWGFSFLPSLHSRASTILVLCRALYCGWKYSLNVVGFLAVASFVAPSLLCLFSSKIFLVVSLKCLKVDLTESWEFFQIFFYSFFSLFNFFFMMPHKLLSRILHCIKCFLNRTQKCFLWFIFSSVVSSVPFLFSIQFVFSFWSFLQHTVFPTNQNAVVQRLACAPAQWVFPVTFLFPFSQSLHQPSLSCHWWLELSCWSSTLKAMVISRSLSSSFLSIFASANRVSLWLRKLCVFSFSSSKCCLSFWFSVTNSVLVPLSSNSLICSLNFLNSSCNEDKAFSSFSRDVLRYWFSVSRFFSEFQRTSSLLQYGSNTLQGFPSMTKFFERWKNIK